MTFMIQTYRPEKAVLVEGIFLVVHEEDILDTKVSIYSEDHLDLLVKNAGWFTVKRSDVEYFILRAKAS